MRVAVNRTLRQSIAWTARRDKRAVAEHITDGRAEFWLRETTGRILRRVSCFTLTFFCYEENLQTPYHGYMCAERSWRALLAATLEGVQGVKNLGLTLAAVTIVVSRTGKSTG